VAELIALTDYLDEIDKLSRGRAIYDQLVIDAIQKARDFGVSWYQIAEALGVTRQAAQQRYGKHMRDG
jgi:hypothetical protein